MAATRSNLGPLTTTFAPPTQCTSYIGNVTEGPVEGYSYESSTYRYGQSCSALLSIGDVGGRQIPVDDSACWPPATVTPTATLFGGYGFYSPGLYCPTGYKTACAAAKDSNGAPMSIANQTSFGFQFPLLANETAYGCCPTGLECYIDSSSVQSCIGSGLPISSFTTSLHVGEAATTAWSLWYCDLSIGSYNDTPTPVVGSLNSSATYFAPLIQINRYGQEGIATSTNGGLSMEAKIGIGVGAGVGAILLLAIALFALWRRRSQGKLTVSSPEQPIFKIAIICALPSEAGMIELILDKDLGDEGLSLRKAPGDQNTYTAGIIKSQNVILAYMPKMGSNSAAAVASGLRASFHEIEVAFVVGICGITPQNIKTQEEIVLGDCVVSTSVIQYDFGRQYPGGFVRKNSADNTMESGNARIRSWISMLMTARNRDRLTEKFHETVEILQGLEGSKSIGYPGVHRDRLFQSSYVHKHRPAGSCPKCIDALGTCMGDCDEVGCQLEYVIQRSEIREPIRSLEFPPKIHFGRFGSANTVMRSGQDRDILASKDQIIAFEMEGSGVWDVFPTVVVKAGCDYADSHKSKEWQRYSAATAAACLKALIERWPSSNSLKEQ